MAEEHPAAAVPLETERVEGVAKKGVFGKCWYAPRQQKVVQNSRGLVPVINGFGSRLATWCPTAASLHGNYCIISIGMCEVSIIF